MAPVVSFQCTASCGHGYQMRAVKCVSELVGSMLDDRECQEASRPSDRQVKAVSSWIRSRNRKWKGVFYTLKHFLHTERILLGLGMLCSTLSALTCTFPLYHDVCENPMNLQKCTFLCTAIPSIRTVHIRTVLKDSVPSMVR